MENRQLDYINHQSSPKKYPLCLLANDIEDSKNVGSLFRIADALGIEKIYLSGKSAVPPDTKISKPARSTDKHVAHLYEKDPLGLIHKLKSENFKIISLEITTVSLPLDDLEITPHERICLILGSENTGISQKLLDLSETTIHIPMHGINSSMNVAVACSIASYHIIRQLKKHEPDHN